MASASLNASVRTETGTGVARKLRQAGSVPAVVYGHGREPQSLTVNTREVERLLQQHSAGSTVIELTVEGREQLERLRASRAEALAPEVARLSEQERDALRSATEIILRIVHPGGADQ